MQELTILWWHRSAIIWFKLGQDQTPLEVQFVLAGQKLPCLNLMHLFFPKGFKVPASVTPSHLQKEKGKKIKWTDCKAFWGGDLASNPVSNHLINNNYVPSILCSFLVQRGRRGSRCSPASLSGPWLHNWPNLVSQPQLLSSLKWEECHHPRNCSTSIKPRISTQHILST